MKNPKNNNWAYALGILVIAVSLISLAASSGAASASFYLLFAGPEGFVKPLLDALSGRIPVILAVLVALSIVAMALSWWWCSLVFSWYPAVSFLQYFSGKSRRKKPAILAINFSLVLAPFVEILVARFFSEYSLVNLQRTFLMMLGVGVFTIFFGLIRGISHTASYLSQLIPKGGVLAWPSVIFTLAGFIYIYIQSWLSGTMGSVPTAIIWHFLFVYTCLASYRRAALLSLEETYDPLDTNDQ